MYCKNRYQRRQLRPNLRSQQGARINEAEGWVQHLNTQAVDARLRAYQNQLKAHIQSHNGGNSTVGDVLGTRKPRIYSLPYLAGTLPYAVRARAAPMSEIPARHKAQFQYAIYANQRSAAWGDGPLLFGSIQPQKQGFPSAEIRRLFTRIQRLFCDPAWLTRH